MSQIFLHHPILPRQVAQGADAISHNPVATVQTLISLCPTHPSSKDNHLSDNLDDTMDLAIIQAIMNTGDINDAMIPDHIWALN